MGASRATGTFVLNPVLGRYCFRRDFPVSAVARSALLFFRRELMAGTQSPAEMTGSTPFAPMSPHDGHRRARLSTSREGLPERRRRRRALVSIPIRVGSNGASTGGSYEVSTTVDVSRLGVLFVTERRDYLRDATVRVVFPFTRGETQQIEQEARVVRVSELSNGRRAVAIALVSPEPCPALRDASGPQSGQAEAQELKLGADSGRRGELKPLVLILDSQVDVLETIRPPLSDEGYEVIAVSNASDAHDVLKLFTPVMVIAEIEGDGFPGYSLCAHVKATPRLQRIPVVLTTRSANPSDYSGAHALGAVVCMAKPFPKDRLLHIARLLAPLKSQNSRAR